MSEREAINHLKDSFYTTPKITRQVMTYKDWQETAMATQCRIIALGETWELSAKHLGGGMYEVTASPPYWKDGKPKRAKPGQKAPEKKGSAL